MKLGREINYKFTATDATGAATKSVESGIQRLGSLAKTYGPIIAGAFGVAGLAKATDLFIRQEQAVFQLEQRLKSTGGVAGWSSEQLQSMASALQGMTTYGDEAIIEMESLLLTFTNIHGEIYEQALPAVLDMSTAMGKDLQSSALQLGKALNDPIRGVAALAESGIQFSNSQREQIKALVETGQTAEAQRIILKELETQFGGAAKAARQGLGGSLESLQNSFGDALEKIGSGNTGFIGSIHELEAVITSKEFQGGLSAIAKGIGWIGTVAAEVTAQIGVAAEMWSNDAVARVRQIVDRQAQLREEMANIPEGGITGALLSIRRGQIQDELAALAEEYQTLVKLAAFNTLPEPATRRKTSGGGKVTPGSIVAMDREEWDSILGQQELDDAVAAITNFQAQLRVRLAEAPPLSLGFSAFDVAASMARRPEEPDDGGIAAAERLAGLQLSLMSENELVHSAYYDRMARINQARALDAENAAHYDQLAIQAAQDREDALANIVLTAEEKKNRIREMQVGVGLNILGMLQSGAMKNSKKGFEVAKVAAIAETTINTYRSATGAYAALAPIPVVGPALGTAAAAVAIAAGMANVSAIQAQSFSSAGGGGGNVGAAISPPGFGAGSPGSPVVTQPIPPQQQGGTQEITIRLIGAVSEAYVENELVPLLNAAHGRNVTMTFAKE